MNLTVMNHNDARSIAEQPDEFCIEDVREALRVILAHPLSDSASPKSRTDRARRINRLEAEIASGRVA